MTTATKLLYTDIEKLKAPFEKDCVGVKIQSLSKDKTKAMLVCYIQHTYFYNRLDSVDPDWSSEIVSTKRVIEKTERSEYARVFVRMKMTVKGVSRENVGEGEDLKSATSDAMKRVAMLFGVGRYMYDTETVWVPYSESQDRFRVWTFDDHQNALRRGQERTPIAEDFERESPLAGEPAHIRPLASSGHASQIKPSEGMTRIQLGKEINTVSNQIKLSKNDRDQWIHELYKTTSEKLTDAQMKNFLEVLQGELGRR